MTQKYSVEYQLYPDGKLHACVALDNGDWIADCGPMYLPGCADNAILIVDRLNNANKTRGGVHLGNTAGHDVAVVEGVDFAEDSTRYVNFYHCDKCDVDWESIWSCMCNDRCPYCRTEIEPYQSNYFYEDD